jgi:hypothetical protein
MGTHLNKQYQLLTYVRKEGSMKSTAHVKSAQQFGFVNGMLCNRPSTLLLAFLTVVLSLLPMAASRADSSPEEDPQAGEVELVQATHSAAPVFPADGVYLYGQAPEADQLGMGYMVFEAVNQRLVGALYMPSSSFDCFEGQLQGSELAMMITNSYTQETYPYGVALVTEGAIASATNTLAPLTLDGFHQISTPSENDLRMLAVCKANLQ